MRNVRMRATVIRPLVWYAPDDESYYYARHTITHEILYVIERIEEGVYKLHTAGTLEKKIFHCKDYSEVVRYCEDEIEN